MSEWISVDDRLPEQEDCFLKTSIIGQLDFGSVLELQFADGVFYRDGVELDNVVYWQPMPLPEPPAK